MQKLSLKYGLMAGGIMAIIFAASWILISGDSPNYGLSEVIGYTAMILSLSVIFMALKEYREMRVPQGMTVWQGFRVGAVITLIAALIFTVIDSIYSNIINPDFFDNYLRYQMQLEEAKGTSVAVIEQMKADMEAFRNPLLMGAVMFMTVAGVGLIISLIAALVMQKKEKQITA